MAKKAKKSSKVFSEHSDSHSRTIAKTITYRILIVISIFIITYIQTKKLNDATAITGVSAVAGTIIYYLHERVWSKIKWGKK